MIKKRINHTHNSEQGNVLIIILITVALLAALTFTLTKSDRDRNNVADAGTIKVRTSEALKYVSNLDITVNTMMRNGISVDELNFENDVTTYSNFICPAENRCKVFHREGGGMKWKSPPKNINDGTEWTVHRGVNVVDIGSDTRADLTIVLPNVTEAACKAFNKTIGHDWTSIPEDDAMWNNLLYQSQFATGAWIDCAASSSECTGKKSACISIQNTNGNSSGVQSYVFYHVLRPN